MNDISRINFNAREAARVKLRKPRHEDPLASRASASARFIFWGQWAAATVIQVAVLIALTLDKSGDVSSHYRLLAVVSSLLAIPL